MMALQEIPLASPVPTTAPHPRDVGRQLLAARQVPIETCGFVGGIFSSSIICPAYSICAQNTAVEALFCCNSYLFPYCGVGPTSCVDSADIAASCTGVCPFDDSVVKCTQGSYTNCALTKYSISTLNQPITGFGCNTARGSLTAFDYYSNSAGGINHAAATASQVNGLTAAATASAGASGASAAFGNGGVNPSLGGSNSGSGSGSGTSTSSSSSSSGLSTGAIVGIVIGGVAGIAIILGLIALLCVQRRRHRRQQQHNLPNPNPNLNQNPMVQAPMYSDAASPFPPQSPPVAPFPAAPAQMNNHPNNNHASMTSFPPNPSSQTSSTPLTQANIAAMSSSQQPSHQPSEISPHESASQIGAYPGTASVLSQGSPPTYHSTAGASNTASQEQHSGLGPLPGPQYATGAAAFPHGGDGGGVASSSVMSPGSVFGSLPPVHAPSVTGTHT